MERGDKIKDHKGKEYIISWVTDEGVPFRKCFTANGKNYGYVPIYVEKPKLLSEYTVEERLESNIKSYEYELGWCKDNNVQIFYLNEIVELKTRLIKLRHCI